MVEVLGNFFLLLKHGESKGACEWAVYRLPSSVWKPSLTLWSITRRDGTTCSFVFILAFIYGDLYNRVPGTCPLGNFIKYSSSHVFKMSEWEKYSSLMVVEFLGKTNCLQYSAVVLKMNRKCVHTDFPGEGHHTRSHVKDEERSSRFQDPL